MKDVALPKKTTIEVYFRRRMIRYRWATLDVEWTKDRGVITPLAIYPEYRISDLGELSQAHGKLDAQFIYNNHSQRTSTSPQPRSSRH